MSYRVKLLLLARVWAGIVSILIIKAAIGDPLALEYLPQNKSKLSPPRQSRQEGINPTATGVGRYLGREQKLE